MNILITICARGGSKGIPGKNIKLLNNLPLISYTINSAKKFAKIYNADITLSTDSLEIKNISEKFDLYTDYIRPSELAQDETSKIDALRDIWRFEENNRKLKYDYFLDLDITSPLRTLEDLIKSFNILINHPEAINLYSVSPPARNPYFNMVELNDEGYAYVCKKLPNNIFTRQSAPKVYAVNASFYFYKRQFYENMYKTATTDKTLIYDIPHLCFDLDEPIDFEFLSYLMSEKKLDFEI